MSDERTRTYTLDELRTMKGRTDWARFDAVPEDELDEASREEEERYGFSPDSYRRAVVVLPNDAPEAEKEKVTIRLDRDVLAYFRGAGKGYQTRINDALRVFMQNMQNAHRR